VVPGTFPKELSRDFHKAFELRQVSDYKVLSTLDSAKAEETLKNAERFVAKVKKYLLK